MGLLILGSVWHARKGGPIPLSCKCVCGTNSALMAIASGGIGRQDWRQGIIGSDRARGTSAAAKRNTVQRMITMASTNDLSG